MAHIAAGPAFVNVLPPVQAPGIRCLFAFGLRPFSFWLFRQQRLTHRTREPDESIIRDHWRAQAFLFEVRRGTRSAGFRVERRDGRWRPAVYVAP